MALSIVPLAPSHKLGAFSCGNDEIDRYLHEHARNEHVRGVTAVHVAIDASETVQAFFTLSNLSIRTDPALLAALQEAGWPYPVISGFLLGRLGRSTTLAGSAVGAAMLSRAIYIAQKQRVASSGVFLAVDPKDEKWLVEWYERLNFVHLAPPSRRMIYSLL